ncbi:AfsR/SARP family transcriptional regulator [Nocardiopsis potens]|uniref:AfsR/SARP family transcriptional regulator n=1 Tax=Nocardiopsis potens TaxID=1246458 RepID=UPI00034D197C|nr:BTAD domain-containing putative transcriptional regulator [Nocardiopsis potens]
MELHILGPLRASAGGRPVRLGGRRARLLLALLAVEKGRVVPVARLIDELWSERPPASARTQVAIVVSGVRRAFREAGGGPVIDTAGAGYRLRAEEVRLDAEEAAREVAAARAAARAGRHAAAEEGLRRALALWRGPVLCGLEGAAVEAAAHHWEELRAAAAEELAEAGFAQGRYREQIGDLGALVARDPLRERPRELLMAALARSGRRAEALEVYAEGRRLLGERLGVDPGRRLRALHGAILREARGEEDGGGPRPGELPAAVSSFTGRTAELAALDGLTASAARHLRLAVVTGPEGAGKTGLVLHWAQQAARAFPDGQLFADLHGAEHGGPRAPIEPGKVLGRFLRALGAAADRVPEAPEERAGLYRTLLRGRRVLVVLDDAASAEQVRPLLPGSPSCCVLVTSREPLRDLVARYGARRLELGPLPPQDAVDLACRLSGGALGADALRLTEACGRMPLGIRMAVARHSGPR